MKTLILLFQGLLVFFVTIIAVYHAVCLNMFILGKGYWPSEINSQVILTISILVAMFMSIAYFTDELEKE